MSQERRNYDKQARTPAGRTPRRPSKGRAASFVFFYVVGVIGLSIFLACVGWIIANDVLALNKEDRQITITITQEDSFQDIVRRLDDEGLIEHPFFFKLFANLTGGKDKVVMGTYTLNTDMDYRALLAGMSVNSATKAEVVVTIPEGYTITQIFQLLENRGVATVEALNEKAANHDYAFSFLQDIPLGDPNRLEGFLYPDTYTFNTPHNPLYVINKMLVNFDGKYTEQLRQTVADSDYSIRELLTIASLIERETDDTDREKIASVIYNRLNNPNGGTLGKLQIDATLFYLTGQTPKEADKSIDSPYNTYMYAGLPPAPIANPGMDSFIAALKPAKTDFFYYALGDDNVHHYFKNYDQMLSFLASQKLYNP